MHAIRYAPLEFDGWQQRHWTLPFAGERFSIVWFTPRGCEEVLTSAYIHPSIHPADDGLPV